MASQDNRTVGYSRVFCEILAIPLFAESLLIPPSRSRFTRPSRAAAVKGGRKAGACALPLTAVSTMASAFRSAGGG